MTNDLKHCVQQAVEELKAVDVKVLDVAGLTSITDTMVICSGTSSRHVKSIAENVIEQARKHGFRTLGTEGLRESEWVLVDLGDAVVHVMQAQTRAHYQLEKLWTFRPPEPGSSSAPG